PITSKTPLTVDVVGHSFISRIEKGDAPTLKQEEKEIGASFHLHGWLGATVLRISNKVTTRIWQTQAKVVILQIGENDIPFPSIISKPPPPPPPPTPYQLNSPAILWTWRPMFWPSTHRYKRYTSGPFIRDTGTPPTDTFMTLH
ncbi:unnamed protein product, partial [Owenia fusiformis]